MIRRPQDVLSRQQTLRERDLSHSAFLEYEKNKRWMWGPWGDEARGASEGQEQVKQFFDP